MAPFSNSRRHNFSITSQNAMKLFILYNYHICFIDLYMKKTIGKRNKTTLLRASDTKKWKKADRTKIRRCRGANCTFSNRYWPLNSMINKIYCEIISNRFNICEKLIFDVSRKLECFGLRIFSFYGHFYISKVHQS